MNESLPVLTDSKWTGGLELNCILWGQILLVRFNSHPNDSGCNTEQSDMVQWKRKIITYLRLQWLNISYDWELIIKNCWYLNYLKWIVAFIVVGIKPLSKVLPAVFCQNDKGDCSDCCINFITGYPLLERLWYLFSLLTAYYNKQTGLSFLQKFVCRSITPCACGTFTLPHLTVFFMRCLVL